MTSKGNRTSIYLGPPLEQLLNERGERHSRSALVNAFAERYQAAVQQSMPAFRLTEWVLLLYALGKYLGVEGSAIQAIHALPYRVQDVIEFDRLDAKWGDQVDTNDLLARLQALSFAERMAVHDAVERWWLSQPKGIVEDDGYGVISELVRPEAILDEGEQAPDET